MVVLYNMFVAGVRLSLVEFGTNCTKKIEVWAVGYDYGTSIFAS